MKHKETAFEWEDLEELWESSVKGSQIQIQLSDLINELKMNTGQFEMNAIQRDLEELDPYFSDFKDMTSQFEKDSIKNDLAKITESLRSFFDFFKKRN